MLKFRLRSVVILVFLIALVVSSCTSSSSDQPEPAAGSSSTAGNDPASTDDAADITTAGVQASFEDLDLIVDYAMRNTGVPGIAVAVVFEDEMLYAQGYGVRDVDGSAPVEPETIFQIASLSKPISSTVMAGAVGQGVFAWNDPVSAYSQGFELSDAFVTDNVTFADLFSHRSGILGSAGNDLETIGYDRNEILFRLRFLELNPFRSTYAYSNFAMTAAGESAAMAAGTTWEDLADKTLFGPAGMTATSMRFTDYADADNRAELHIQLDGAWVSDLSRMPDAQAPAGGVSSNVIDLARWMRIQLSGGVLEGQRIIDEDALNLTHTPMILRRPPSPTIAGIAGFYGLGWNIEVDATGATRWNHSGAFSTGAATTTSLLPGEGLGIVVLTNGAPIGVPEAIADAYFDLLQIGEWSDDTFALWSDRFAGVYGDPLELDDPGDDFQPALANNVYVGTYANDYVGEIDVIDVGGGLFIVEGPVQVTYELTHFDADTFTYVHDPELPTYPTSVVFTVDAEGPASSVSVSAFADNGQDMLRRR